MQSRDFIHVDDVVAVNLWFLDHPGVSGIFNLGTGRAQPFNDVALAVVNAGRERAGQPALALDEMVRAGLVELHRLPRRPGGTSASPRPTCRGCAAGCDHVCRSTGVRRYATLARDWLVRGRRTLIPRTADQA